MHCKICRSASEYILQKTVLNRYPVKYFQCQNCGFIQTEDPYWLAEAYSEAIADLDVGLIRRNLVFSKAAAGLIERYFDPNGRFLDYGGGYGMFVRLMRDNGFQFYRQDKYCQNLFAKYFDLADLPAEERKFELVTAFEVMEHLADPVEELGRLLDLSRNILFSTEIAPAHNLEEWWYLGAETGQHIALFSTASLQYLAGKLHLNFYSNGQTLHLFTDKTMKENPFFPPKTKKSGIRRFYDKVKKQFAEPTPARQPRASLLQQDFAYIKGILHTK